MPSSTLSSLGAARRLSLSTAIPTISSSPRKTGPITLSASRASLRQILRRSSGKATGQSDLDAIIDCAGAPEMMQLGFSLLSISGHYADVGLVGDRIDIPLFPRVSREQTFHGSFWGNYTDLSEVMALAAQGKIRHTLEMFTFDQINEYIDLLRKGDIVGRAVMKF